MFHVAGELKNALDLERFSHAFELEDAAYPVRSRCLLHCFCAHALCFVGCLILQTFVYECLQMFMILARKPQ